MQLLKWIRTGLFLTLLFVGLRIAFCPVQMTQTELSLLIAISNLLSLVAKEARTASASTAQTSCAICSLSTQQNLHTPHNG